MKTLVAAIALVTCSLAVAQTVIPPSLRAAIPQLRVSPKVATKRDADRNVSYRQTMRITPQLSIEGAQTKPLPEMEATMMVIVLDTRAKYVDHEEKLEVLSNEMLTIPAVEQGKLRQFEFKSSLTSYDAYRDKSNVGGKAYKCFFFALREKASGLYLHIECTQSPLLAYLKSHPDVLPTFLAKKAGADVPANYK